MNESVLHSAIKNPVDLRLRRIADVLLLNGSFTDNPGLLNGMMGIAIFMYHYARKTGREVYGNYADELIDEIYEAINTQTPVDFENGLAGIGWGIEYLVRNGFVQADTDEALAEIDNTISRSILQPPVLNEDGNDLFDHGFYYLARLKGRESGNDNLNSGIKNQHLIYLIDECERLIMLKNYSDPNIKSISIGAINSITWFLLEIHKLGLFQSKVDKLLGQLPSELEFTLKSNNDPAEEFVLWYLIQNIIPLINDPELQKKYIAHANKVDDKRRGTSNKDDTLTHIYSSITWQRLIYFPYLKDENFLPDFNEKVFNIIDDEENWSNLLDNLNKDNIGLTGLAGLGFGLMNG